MNLKFFFKECIVFLREFAALCIPKTKSEKLFFLIISFVYLAFSRFFIFNTFMLDHPEVSHSTFLGFDTQYIMRRGYGNITAHPFMGFFSAPFAYIGNIFAVIFGYKAKTFFLVLICTYIVVQSQIIVRRYLLNIIGLGVRNSNILTIFFSVFASNFALAMAYESFTFSFFFLSIATYYFSIKLKDKKEITLASGLILGLSIGGITITNLGKILSVYFFDGSHLKKIIKKQIIILSTFFAVFAGFAGILFYFFKRERIFDIFARYDEYTQPDFYLPQETVHTVLSRFFGGPILFPGYQVIDRSLPDGPYTVLSNYDNFWQYGFTLIVIALLLWSIISHINNKLVLFISINFFMDIIIHIFLKYGLGESFIYAGHWIFTYPIFLGWLIKDQNKKVGNLITLVIIGFTLITVCNNTLKFYEIYQHFGLPYYGTT